MYRVEVASRAQRELRRVPAPYASRIKEALSTLATNPRPTGSIKLRDVLHRLRIGPYRIIYAIADREQLVVVLKIARREKDTYDDLGGLP